MKYQRVLILLGLLLPGGLALVASDNDYVIAGLDMRSQFDSTKPQDDLTVEIEYRLPVAKWHTTLKWRPENEPVPLDAEGAVKVAKRWIAAQPWADQFEEFDRVELTCWGNPIKPSPETGLWYYKVNFHLKEMSSDKSSHAAPLDLRPNSVVLLFDGTVIEPTISKPVRRGDKE